MSKLKLSHQSTDPYGTMVFNDDEIPVGMSQNTEVISPNNASQREGTEFS